MWQENLKKMKAASGKTTAEIAKGSGIPEPTLEKLFAGATKDPKLPTMQKLVYYLGYTLEDLCRDEKSTPAPSKDDEGVLTKEELSRISAAMSQLNEEGRERVVEYAEDLAAGGRFKKPCSAEMGKKKA